MPQKINDLSGCRFGRLTVISRAENKGSRVCWLCLCDCGGTTITRGDTLRGGTAESCGCLQKEGMSARTKTHGMHRTKIYAVWQSMKHRCHTPTHKAYHRYGGRGITVCDRWMDSFENFVSDMGDRPTKGHSIERIDNNKGYSPDNCKWATSREQNNNTSSTVKISFLGKTQSIAQWAREYGLHPSTLGKRLKYMSVHDALNTPSRKSRSGRSR